MICFNAWYINCLSETLLDNLSYNFSMLSNDNQRLIIFLLLIGGILAFKGGLIGKLLSKKNTKALAIILFCSISLAFITIINAYSQSKAALIIIGIVIILAVSKRSRGVSQKSNTYKYCSNNINDRRKRNGSIYNRLYNVDRFYSEINNAIHEQIDELIKDKYKVYENITLHINKSKGDFDYIVIGENGIFNVMIENSLSKIQYDESGKSSQEDLRRRELARGSLIKIKGSKKLISSLFDNRYPVIDVVVKREAISVTKNTNIDNINLIGYDNLRDFIIGYNSSRKISNVDIKIIDNFINESSKKANYRL